MGRLDLPDPVRDEDLVYDLDETTASMNYFATKPLPVFENAAEGLSFLDEQEEAARKQMEEEAMRAMAAAQDDPTSQNYFMRLDRKTVVKTEQEYAACLKNQVPMKVVPYTTAVQLLKEEEARAKQRKKAKAKKKTARASRKRNRK